MGVTTNQSSASTTRLTNQEGKHKWVGILAVDLS